MKKLLFVLFGFLIFANMVIGQNYYIGTVESAGGEVNKGVLANGLTELFSVTGNYTISADGAGSLAASYNIQVDKPNNSATVYKAFLLGAPRWNSSGNCTELNGQSIDWDGSSPSAWGCCNYYDDVTSIVASVVDPAGMGILNIPISECSNMDGYALVVIFSDPLANEKTIVVMFGGLSPSGDSFSISLSQPIDPNATGVVLDMGLGISFGAQGECDAQYSTIDVNGQRLTTSAGGEDDGELADGALITVGGIDDLNSNPPDPFGLAGCNPRYDDELYSLLPLIDDATTSIMVNTANPSYDDNVFLAYFEISGVAIIGEGILLSQIINNPEVGSNHIVKALVQDDNGNPVVDKLVDFEVISGPNSGTTYSASTNSDGEVSFVYSSVNAGTDEVQACFINNQGVTQCSSVLLVNWWESTGAIINVDPSSLTQSLYPDEMATQILTISNTGDADLVFDLEDIETSKRLKIKSVKKTINDGDRSDDFLNYLNEQLKNGPKSVRDISWLSEDPLLGTIAPGGSLDIEVGFDATGLAPDIYNAQILINSNDLLTPQFIVPVTLEVMSMNCSYLTTSDNENNALEGIPDYDMDEYLCDDSPIVPIEFNIFVEASEITSAQLSIYAWDVDEQGTIPGYPEVDEVYFNGHLIGTLTGADEQWSTSVFNIDPSFVNPGPDGKNLVNILVSTLGPYWCVNIDWGQLVVNNCMDEAYIRSVDLDKYLYQPGENVEITVEVDSYLPTQEVVVETNLLDENMVNVAGISNTITIHLEEDEPLSVTLPLPITATPGATYEAQVIVYDANSYLQQDLALVPFEIWDGDGFCMEPGWQLISSCYEPPNPDLDVLMADLNAGESLVIMLNRSGIYWPSKNINMLGDWDAHSGYKVKMAEFGCVDFGEEEVMDKNVDLLTGTNYLPVLSTFNVPAADIFNQLGADLLFAFDLVNNLVYWPEGGLFTLQTLEPGKGYLVNMINPGAVTFPATKGNFEIAKPLPQIVHNAPWSVDNTGSAHIISIYASAVEGLHKGDIVAVFNSEDVCVGMVQYNGNNENLSLIVHGDDFTTEAIDGMIEDELMHFAVYKSSTDETIQVQPSWDVSMTHAGIFMENGLSAITNFKLGALGVADQVLSNIAIFPNPSTGIFNLSGIDSPVQVSVLNSTGQEIQKLQTASRAQIDLSKVAKGIYFVKMISDNAVRIEKIIVE